MARKIQYFSVKHAALIGVLTILTSIFVWFTFRDIAPMFRFNKYLYLSRIIEEYYDHTGKLPPSKSTFTNWLLIQHPDINVLILDEIVINWDVVVSEFLQGKAEVIVSINGERELGITMNRHLRSRISSIKANINQNPK